MLAHHDKLHEGVLQNYRNGKSSLCSSDYELLHDWRFDTNITVDKESYLTISGWNEFVGIGQRFQAAFPTLLPANYSTRDYFFRHTDRQRTLASLRAFADGLFGYNGHEQVEFEDIADPDLLLRPHDNCPLYDNVTGNDIEENAFKAGQEYQQMLTQVSTKLGFHGAEHLTAEQVETVDAMCRFEQIWNLEMTSPWCAAFSIANMAVVEYREDLDYFWSVGFGYREQFRPLIENMNCRLMQDMLQFIASNNSSDHLTRIFNTHSSMLQLIIVNLGVFEDDVLLTRHNFAQQTERLWRSSLIAPMAANLAVVRYE